MTFVVGALVIGAVWFYQYKWPKSSYEEYIAVSVGLQFFLPLLAVLIGMRSSPETFGLAAGNPRLSLRYGVGMLLLILPVLAISSRTQGAMDYYPLFRQHRLHLTWGYVLYFELLYGLYLLTWEWFFRGFLLFGLARGMGSWALFAQAIPFGLLHWGKPMPEFISAFFGGLILGFVAMRTGSFLTGFLVHWAIAVLYDLLVLLALAAHGTHLF
jgi:membrane protease YdiL (CAAX protease family)